MNFKRFLVMTSLLAAGILLGGCATNFDAKESFTPGLGEIMTLTSSRHAKLWYAGEGRNWALAQYELEELREGLDDAGKFHPTHKSSRAPIPQLITATMTSPLRALGTAIEAHDLTQFQRSFDALTAACNACHQASEFGFNVVVRPGLNPFSNQSFSSEG